MSDVYKIGVTIALTNLATAELIRIADLFGAVDKKALALNASMRLLAVGGIAAVGLAMKSAISSSMEYAHQLNIMNMAGLKQAEISQAVAASWRNTSTVLTTTATGNLKTLLDLRNVLGTMPEAMEMLETVTKVQAVMSASTEGGIRDNADDIAYGMAKALDVIGAASGAKLQREAEMMSKVVTATQGRVQPQMFQGVFTYARQSRFDLSDEFKYEILPSLMQEMAAGKNSSGGGSRGVGPMLAAFYRLTNQGYINKKALPALQEMGLVDPSTALKTTTSGTTVGAMKDASLAASNPFLWVNQVLVPAIRRTYGADMSDEGVRQKINEVMRGNQLAASMAVEFFTKEKNFVRDQAIVRGAMGYQEAYSTAEKNDPYYAVNAVKAQWENVKISFGNFVAPVVIPTLKYIAEFFNFLGKVFRWIHEAVSQVYGGIDWLAEKAASPVNSGIQWLKGGGSTAGPPPPSRQPVVIDHKTLLDGSVLAKSVTQYQIEGMAKAPSAGNGQDIRLSPGYSGFGFAY